MQGGRAARAHEPEIYVVCAEVFEGAEGGGDGGEMGDVGGEGGALEDEETLFVLDLAEQGYATSCLIYARVRLLTGGGFGGGNAG